MIYGYLRVSSDTQDVATQRQGVEAFAQKRQWPIEKYITDGGVSGGKDPSKRKLGPLLKKLRKGDIIIASEISRLGRDLYMVMDILHHCMKVGCIIYTVKDGFTLGDDIQSKVLAFAFGLSAEIERQMIRQRTTEGVRLRMKLGVLVGRPPGTRTDPKKNKLYGKDELIQNLQAKGVSGRKIARICKVDRGALARYLNGGYEYRWQEKTDREKRKNAGSLYANDRQDCEQMPRAELRRLIEEDKTVPEIAELYKGIDYEAIYYTILYDRELNRLYRQHGQLRVRKMRYR